MTIVSKNLIQFIFSILFICFTVVASAGYIFHPQDDIKNESFKEATVIKKEKRFKRFVKKMSRKIQRIKKEVLPKTIFKTLGEDNKHGTTALFSLLTSVFVRIWAFFIGSPGVFIVLGFLLILISLIYAAKGKKTDKNTKRAKTIFGIDMVILALNFVALALLIL